MKSIKEFLVRIGKAKGFGIQSPWAYSFVRDVIMEELDYYAYAEIDAAYNNPKENKYQKLLHRLRNYAHGRDIKIIDFSNTTDETIIGVMNTLHNDDFVVLRNTDKDYERFSSIAHKKEVGIVFDLYESAICFAPDNRHKQHYKLNF